MLFIQDWTNEGDTSTIIYPRTGLFQITDVAFATMIDWEGTAQDFVDLTWPDLFHYLAGINLRHVYR